MQTKIFLPKVSNLNVHKKSMFLTFTILILDIILVAGVAITYRDYHLLIFSIFYMLVVMIASLSCLPLKQISHSTNFAYAQSSTGKYYIVDLMSLNEMLVDGQKKYEFKKGFGIYRSANIERLLPHEKEALYTGIDQAIQDVENKVVTNTKVMRNPQSPLISLIQPRLPFVSEMREMRLIKEDIRSYHVTYKGLHGLKNQRIYKIYPEFNPFQLDETSVRVLKPLKYPLILCVVLTLLALIVFI